MFFFSGFVKWTRHSLVPLEEKASFSQINICKAQK